MTHTTITTHDGTTTISEQTFEGFRGKLPGPLLTPSNTGFEETTRIWNGMIETSPALGVQPTK